MKIPLFLVLSCFIVGVSFVPKEQATDFEATTIDGEKIQLSKLKGKVVVLNFWFKNCKPCLMEIPELHKLTEKYTKQDVVFIALSTDSEEVVKSYLAENKFAFKHIANARPIAKEWSVKGYPTNVVIDKKGEVSFRKTGLELRPNAQGENVPKTPDDIDKEIEKLLKK